MEFFVDHLLPRARITPRVRWVYAAAALLVIALGLASRRLPGVSSILLGKLPGDALWALMIFVLAGIALPRGSTHRVALVALAICFAVEFSQLYQAPWIESIRRTTLGHLVLGSRFHWPDLPAYALGVASGAIIEWWVARRSRRRAAAPSTPT